MDRGERGEKKGAEGITLAGSGSWITAKKKKKRSERKKNKIVQEKYLSLTSKKHGSKGTRRQTERQLRTTAMGEDRMEEMERGGDGAGTFFSCFS